MNIIWKQGLSYQENYDNLLEKLNEDNKEWNTSEPPQDGTILYFKCADTSYNNEYGYCLREYATESEVIQALDDNPYYEDVKVIVGKSLEIVKRHELEGH